MTERLGQAVAIGIVCGMLAGGLALLAFARIGVDGGALPLLLAGDVGFLSAFLVIWAS